MARVSGRSVRQAASGEKPPVSEADETLDDHLLGASGVTPTPELFANDVVVGVETVAEMSGTLDTYRLAPSGETFKLTFDVVVEDAEEIIKLNAIKQRVCRIEVKRTRRSSRTSFGGLEDEEDGDDDAD